MIVLVGAGCKSQDARMIPARPLEALQARPLQSIVTPSNHRNWAADLTVLSYADVGSNQVTVYNVRDFIYQSDEDYVVRYSDRTFDLNDLQTVDFVIVPFKDAPTLAHTMLSFGFGNGQYLGVSVEARLEVGEEYSPLMGGLRQYELIYVVADERDLIARRTRHRDVEVYLISDGCLSRTNTGPVCLRNAAGRRISDRAGILRHADQQLHIEHCPTHQ